MTAVPAPSTTRPRRAPSTDAAPLAPRHLRAVPEARPRSRTGLLVFAGFVFLGLSFFAVVALNVLTAQGQFEVDRLAEQTAAEQRRYERLRLDLAERSSPAAIVGAAQALGLVVPDQVNYVEVPGLPSTAGQDSTSTTLDDSWQGVKPSLGAAP